MSILEELTHLFRGLDVPVETGIFSDKAPNTYAVITPLTDTFALHADNVPQIDVQEARISLYTKGSYTSLKNRIVRALIRAEYTITDRRYLGFETGTGYHHYAVDAAKQYDFETEEE